MTSEIEDDEDEFDDEARDEDADDVDADDVVLDDLVEEDDGEQDEDALIDPKERAARSLEIRRAIEERVDEKRLDEDLNYLDADLDED